MTRSERNRYEDEIASLKDEVHRLEAAAKRLKREHESYVTRASRFVKATWDLLLMIGMNEGEILRYYERKKHGC